MTQKLKSITVRSCP